MPNREIIKKELPRTQRNVSLSKYTTFRIGGPAEYFSVVKTENDLIKTIKTAKKIRLPFFVLGGGSNLLVSDKGFRGIVINLQFSILNFRKSKIITGAGTSLGKLVNTSAKKGLSGLEWAAGIPGTIGGAILGNAGAFGRSIAEAVEEVRVLDVRRKPRIKNYKLRSCKFEYRDSIFKGNPHLIILSAVLKLKKSKKLEILRKMKGYLDYRRKNQPFNFPSAGSVFKNPSDKFDKSAGWLIEKAGLKGKRINDAQISEKHANFIVNLGKAKAKDVVKLINLIKSRVKNKFGIKMEEEISYLGF